MFDTLKKLCRVPSVSGREEKIRESITQLISPFSDEIRTDSLGNLIAVRYGTAHGNGAKKLMLCAHMDEIGFLATYIEDSGFIRAASVGGINFSAAAFSHVVSGRGVGGVIVPETGTKPADFAQDKFYIDIGAKDKKEAERKVKVGDFFVVRPDVVRLAGKRVAGRPLDDRAGCAVMIDAARKIAESPCECDVYYVFSVQEEVGCRGAKPASFSVAPDYALVFDVTGTGDTAGAKPMAVKLGGGAAIKIKDSSVICHARVVDSLISLARENSIPYQCEVLTYGGTDTSSIQMSGAGVMVGALSIPTRYIHTGTEMLDLGDAAACSELAVAFAHSLK